MPPRDKGHRVRVDLSLEEDSLVITANQLLAAVFDGLRSWSQGCNLEQEAGTGTEGESVDATSSSQASGGQGQHSSLLAHLSFSRSTLGQELVYQVTTTSDDEVSAPPEKEAQQVKEMVEKGADSFVVGQSSAGKEEVVVDPEDCLFLEGETPLPLGPLCPPVVLHILPAYLMPVPPFLITVQGTSRMVDAFNKEYTDYHILVRHGSLEWIIHKRYSEFWDLHAALASGEGGSTGVIERHLLPQLPPKHIRNTSDDVISSRQSKLEDYLRRLVGIPQATQNIHVLSFLGLMSTSRQELIKFTPPTAAKPRQVVHLSALKKYLRCGDIVLFKCANTISGLQRRVTGSEWDHVALVVANSRSAKGLSLLESTGEGVTVLPVFERSEFTYYMAWRSLEGELSQPEAILERMVKYVQNVDGKPYGMSLKKIFASSKKKIQSTSNPPQEGDLGGKSQEEGLQVNEKEGYFCSELVSSALINMEILNDEYPASYYWPGSFGEGGEVEKNMRGGLRYGPVILLDCKVMEVGKARHRIPVP